MTRRLTKVSWVAISAIASLMVTGAKAAEGAGRAPPTAPPPITEHSTWSVRLPKNDAVVYVGEVSFDQAGKGTNSMMYPAPNAVGMLIGVITHGLLVESSKHNQKDKIQEEADKVLVPYQPVLSKYTHQELMQRGLQMASTPGDKKLVKSSEGFKGDWIVDSEPVFSMTQDQGAIVLTNSLLVYAPGAPAAAATRHTVRVVSGPREETDLAGFWTANEGEKLKEESASLFAQSLDIALREASGATDKGDDAFKTVRYLQGKTEKMERGRVIGAHCDRILLKTLRGWFMSVPVAHDTTDATSADACAKAPAS